MVPGRVGLTPVSDDMGPNSHNMSPARTSKSKTNAGSASKDYPPAVTDLSNAELSRHAIILMLKNVAVVHDGGFYRGLVESDKQLHRFFDEHRVPCALIQNVRLSTRAA